MKKIFFLLAVILSFSTNYISALEQHIFEGDVEGFGGQQVAKSTNVIWSDERSNANVSYNESKGEITVISPITNNYRVRVNLNTGGKTGFKLVMGSLVVPLAETANGEFIDKVYLLTSGTKISVRNDSGGTIRVNTASDINIYRILASPAIDVEFCTDPEITPGNTNLPYCSVLTDSRLISYNSQISEFTFLKTGFYNVTSEIETDENSQVNIRYGTMGAQSAQLTSSTEEGQVDFDYNFFAGDTIYVLNNSGSPVEVKDGFLRVTEITTAKKRNRRNRRRCICNCRCCDENKKECHHKKHKDCHQGK
jgi:hypothetical protein